MKTIVGNYCFVDEFKKSNWRHKKNAIHHQLPKNIKLSISSIYSFSKIQRVISTGVKS